MLHFLESRIHKLFEKLLLYPGQNVNEGTRIWLFLSYEKGEANGD